MTASQTAIAKAADPSLPKIREDEPAILPPQSGGYQLLLDPGAFEHLQRVAKLYSSSNLVPQQYRGNIADCFIALQMSMRLGVDPFMFLQSTYIIGGRPGMMATLGIALVNQRGPFKGPIQFKMTRDGGKKITACAAYATHKNGELCESTVTWEMVEAEGWSKRNGSKWQTIPEQMFRYRSAMFLIRAYCPEVLVGMQTTDELEDTYGNTRYLNQIPQGSGAAALNERLAAVDTEKETGEVVEVAATPEIQDDKPSPKAASKPASKPASKRLKAVMDRMDKLSIMMSEMHEGTSAAACLELISRFSKKVFMVELPELSDAQLASLESSVNSGDISPPATVSTGGAA